MKSNWLFTYLPIISIAAAALSFIIGMIFINRLNSYLKTVLIIIGFGLVVDLANFIIINSGVNNYYIFHLYTIIEFSMWVSFYYLFYKTHIKSYPVFFALIPLFLVIGYVDYSVNGLESMDSISLSCEALILTLFSLFSFRELMNRRIFEDLLNAPFFFVNSAVLLYFLGNLCFFLFANYIYKTEAQNYMASWTIHSLLNITFSTLISLAFWRSKKT